MMARLLTPSCPKPVCLAAVKTKIIAKATPAIPFSIRKARGRSGELGLWVCPGDLLRLLLAYFRHRGIDAMIPRCSKELSCWHDAWLEAGLSYILRESRAGKYECNAARTLKPTHRSDEAGE
jgi:hypothetical protein